MDKWWRPAASAPTASSGYPLTGLAAIRWAARYRSNGSTAVDAARPG
jgi:hypothetical protein